MSEVTITSLQRYEVVTGIIAELQIVVTMADSPATATRQP